MEATPGASTHVRIDQSRERGIGMNLSTLTRTAIGAALTVVLASVTLAPAVAAAGPVVSWVTGPTEGASYVYGLAPATPTCTAVDPGVADPAAAAVPCTVSGYDTSVGTHTVLASATANEVTTTSAITYTVTPWTLKGFLRPLKSGDGVWNKVKGGSVVPLKFTVHQGATKAKSIAVVTGFTSQLVSCTTGTATGEAVALTTTKKGFALKYRDGAFQKNFKTPKATLITKVVTKVTHKGNKTIVKTVKTTVAACYAVSVTTADGSSLRALLRLR
jgi:hypothetical protein